MLAACGYQHIRLYDMNSFMPIVNFEGVAKNVNRIGFQVFLNLIHFAASFLLININDNRRTENGCIRAVKIVVFESGK